MKLPVKVCNCLLNRASWRHALLWRCLAHQLFELPIKPKYLFLCGIWEDVIAALNYKSDTQNLHDAIQEQVAIVTAPSWDVAIQVGRRFETHVTVNDA